MRAALGATALALALLTLGDPGHAQPASQPLAVMTYNLLHGQACNGGSLGADVDARMELAIQGGPNRSPGLVALAPDILGMQEVSQVFVDQPAGENFVCLAGSSPAGMTTVEAFEHQADQILRRMNGVANMRGVEFGQASSTAPSSASPYQMEFRRDNPRVLPFLPDPPTGDDEQTLSDQAAALANFEIGLATISRFPIQRMVVENLSFGSQPGETRAITHATIRIPVAGADLGYDFYDSHLTTGGGQTPQTITMATNIVSFILASRRNPENPAFFVCDCNAVPGSPAYQVFVNAGFVDSFAVANPGAPGFTSGRDNLDQSCGQQTGSRIDYVWAIPDDQGRIPAVLSSWVVMDYFQPLSGGPSGATVCRYPSDHNGVYTRFDLLDLGLP